jgi:DNA polymerase sigma
MLNDLEKSLVQKFRFLLEQQLHVHQLTVFGSRARGDANKDSDLDILVVIEEAETDENRFLVSDCAWEAGLGSGIVINSVLFSRDAWENGPERFSLLALAVQREGLAV